MELKFRLPFLISLDLIFKNTKGYKKEIYLWEKKKCYKICIKEEEISSNLLGFARNLNNFFVLKGKPFKAQK
jgi:hypothetical protein